MSKSNKIQNVLKRFKNLPINSIQSAAVRNGIQLSSGKTDVCVHPDGCVELSGKVMSAGEAAAKVKQIDTRLAIGIMTIHSYFVNFKIV